MAFQKKYQIWSRVWCFCCLLNRTLNTFLSISVSFNLPRLLLWVIRLTFFFFLPNLTLQLRRYNRKRTFFSAKKAAKNYRQRPCGQTCWMCLFRALHVSAISMEYKGLSLGRGWSFASLHLDLPVVPAEWCWHVATSAICIGQDPGFLWQSSVHLIDVYTWCHDLQTEDSSTPGDDPPDWCLHLMSWPADRGQFNSRWWSTWLMSTLDVMTCRPKTVQLQVTIHLIDVYTWCHDLQTEDSPTPGDDPPDWCLHLMSWPTDRGQSNSR